MFNVIENLTLTEHDNEVIIIPPCEVVEITTSFVDDICIKLYFEFKIHPILNGLRYVVLVENEVSVDQVQHIRSMERVLDVESRP